MTTEYYQIPSQQGFLPMPEESADPWLAAATSALSLADWSVSKEKQLTNPPSLFEPEDAEASVSWKNVIPKQYDVKAPVVPKQFTSATSKIDAWSVVDNTPIKLKKVKQTKVATQPAKQAKPAVQQEGANGKPIEDELSTQNVSFSHHIYPYFTT